MAKSKVQLYDTTLRDGTQAEGFSLSVDDKLKVMAALDRLGVHFIEGGWPGSNPRDEEFFERAKKVQLKNSTLVAFGSTHHPKKSPANDANLAALLDSGAQVVALVGKSWTRHLRHQLKISLERNLAMVSGSVDYMVKKGLRVFFDAEHFFDGFKEDPEYALAVLDAAAQAGAEALVLCDTNGGNLPFTISEITAQVAARHKGLTIGIHSHNDSELAVACSLAAVAAGARQVQGTIAGFGERCGNANLCSIIPNLQLKMGYACLGKAQLKNLTRTTRYLFELANIPPERYLPYVGSAAFTHKGGLHISAVEKDPVLYEHVIPETVGNQRRLLVSDLAGRAAVLAKAKTWGIDLDGKEDETQAILNELKEREKEGFQYEGAEASFELLMCRARGAKAHYFDLVGFRVMDYKAAEHDAPQAEATVRVRVGDQEEHTAASGNGPVHALDQAIRKALTRFFPVLQEVRLVDYKVRVLTGQDGTAAKVRVLIESSDGKTTWGTVGVSEDVLEASWQALGDSIRYRLYQESRG
ncbi:transferase [Desulfocarbo indianensis]|nr:transferase [Desulfocarbo indianensis]